MTAGTNHAVIWSTTRLDRQLAALGFLDHADDLGQHGVAAHLGGAEAGSCPMY